MRILVTGSSGLIGSAVCPILEHEGFGVRKMDIRLNPKTMEKPEFGNLMEQIELSKATKSVDGIIHLAAVSRVIDAEKNHDLCYWTNVAGLRNLLSMAQKGSKKPWIIFASSREIYGEPKSLPVHESHPLTPINFYGECKKTAEDMLLKVSNKKGIGVVIFRLSNVYGSPFDYPTRVIPAFLTGALRKRTIRIDSPDHVFDFTHVSDVASAILTATSALNSKEIDKNAVFNLSPGTGTSLSQLVDYIRKMTGQDLPTVKGEERNYDVSRYVGDSTKIQNMLGCRCKIELKEGLNLLHDEYLKNWGY
jgi:nucleoside-diphosphate-sugar epimerase